ncbi:MAG TPA: asparaginase [Clostridia bacterium]|nr:asparaginase [Clostridia bacterium]
MSKILIIFTGGTISMSIDKNLGAAVPNLSSDDILGMIKNLDEFSEIEVLNYGEFPGPQISPEKMMELSMLIQENIKREDIQGVILTHGTDTLEETAFFLDLNLKTTKPVVIVGAMRNASELGYDGPSNLAAAIVTVKSPESADQGVLVVLNNEVNAAREVTKTNTLSLDTFKSTEFGPLGIVDNNEVLFFRKRVHYSQILVDHFEKEVYLLKSYAGMDRSLIDFLVKKGARGIVIEAMGRGNLPPLVVKAIKDAIKQDVIVVIVSRCPSGRVLGTYGYEGGGKFIKDLGAFFGTNLNGQKTRIKLMLALAYTQEYSQLKKIMESDSYICIS